MVYKSKTDGRYIDSRAVTCELKPHKAIGWITTAFLQSYYLMSTRFLFFRDSGDFVMARKVIVRSKECFQNVPYPNFEVVNSSFSFQSELFGTP